MSTTINDGGPAFPRPGLPTNWAEGHFEEVKRGGNGSVNDIAADISYTYADAMLAARNKESTQ